MGIKRKGFRRMKIPVITNEGGHIKHGARTEVKELLPRDKTTNCSVPVHSGRPARNVPLFGNFRFVNKITCMAGGAGVEVVKISISTPKGACGHKALERV